MPCVCEVLYITLLVTFLSPLSVHPITFHLCLVYVMCFAGGKTPDPSKRTYADIIAEVRLMAEEVGLSCHVTYCIA